VQAHGKPHVHREPRRSTDWKIFELPAVPLAAASSVLGVLKRLVNA